MPKCTINGKEVEVAAGSTIIQAFDKAKENIAHYCYHPGLSVAGCCRMCMCEIDGNPRPQIACNTPVTEGMKVNNKSQKVVDSVKWVLEFHLINHPLDCPICDQAGECGLQEYYMTYGSYEPEMGERKVKKHKCTSLGDTVVLDSERCILCSRCVRFTDEVTKTGELGIFNRGDHAEVGTFEGKPLNNKYSTNVVDICPVGALTSKDFRFRQRVWFLKEFDTICNGCSTGCNVKVSYNENGLYRVKPVHNAGVNGYWMCDYGRDIYKQANREYRLTKGIHSHNGTKTELSPGATAKAAGQKLKQVVQAFGPDSVALVLTAQYTLEEFDDICKTFAQQMGSKNVFYWVNNPSTFDSFDGMLIRGDKNPNTSGMLQVLEKYGLKKNWSELTTGIANKHFKAIVVAGPENLPVYPDLAEKAKLFSQVENLIWLTPCRSDDLAVAQWQVPMKSFVEKSGTFVNSKGMAQKIKPGTRIVSEALTLSQAALLLSGQEIAFAAEAVSPTI